MSLQEVTLVMTLSSVKFKETVFQNLSQIFCWISTGFSSVQNYLCARHSVLQVLVFFKSSCGSVNNEKRYKTMKGVFTNTKRFNVPSQVSLTTSCLTLGVSQVVSGTTRVGCYALLGRAALTTGTVTSAPCIHMRHYYSALSSR
jgi:hypothetical protein